MPNAHELDQLTLLANSALDLWRLPAGAAARLLNLSENATFLVEAGTCFRAILRIHRPGYHCREAIASELAWADALGRATVIQTPRCIPGHNGEVVQTAGIEGLVAPRHLVLFDYIAGAEPGADGDLIPLLRELGRFAALAHDHARHWQRPSWFTRHAWDADTILGNQATWGHWRHGPGVDPAIRKTLDRLQSVLTDRLSAFGKHPDNYGLIHADMRLTNLLVDGDRTSLIDFDDCGFGWHLYDFGAAVSFMEDDPRVPELKSAWLAAYREHRSLSATDEREIDSFVTLRRLALLGWMGTHPEVNVVRDLAPTFAAGTATLAEAYLTRFG